MEEQCQCGFVPSAETEEARTREWQRSFPAVRLDTVAYLWKSTRDTDGL